MRSCLPTIASIYNPVDIIGDARAERYYQSLKYILADPQVDGVLVILTPTAVVNVKETAEIVAELSSGSSKPVLASFMGKVSVAEGIRVLQDNRVPHYAYPENAIKVFRIMADYRTWLTAPPPSYQTFRAGRKPVKDLIRKTRERRVHALGEEDARAINASYGFITPASSVALDLPGGNQRGR